MFPFHFLFLIFYRVCKYVFVGRRFAVVVQCSHGRNRVANKNVWPITLDSFRERKTNDISHWNTSTFKEKVQKKLHWNKSFCFFSFFWIILVFFFCFCCRCSLFASDAPIAKGKNEWKQRKNKKIFSSSKKFSRFAPHPFDSKFHFIFFFLQPNLFAWTVNFVNLVTNNF